MKKKKKGLKSDFDYTKFESEALKGLLNGQDLIGEGGILKGLIKHLVESALEGELDAHLDEEKSSGETNRRNGHSSKKVRTKVGEVRIDPPRDRNGSFEPQIIGKWDRNLNSGLDHQVLALYSMGNSYEDIQYQISELYGVELSKGQLSAITDRVWQEIEAWQKRALKSFYLVVFLDAIHFKVREHGVVKSKAVYTVYGVDADGYRDVIGLRVGDAEGAREWARVLENLKDRGVKDVLFFAIDGLKGFKDAILSVFPESTIQRCVVHMVRSSLRLVDDKDMKELVKNLRAVYTADDETQALAQLEAFEAKWGHKYPEIGQSWRKNWLELTAFFGFNWAVRKLIYTTNTIEGLHRIMRRTTKTKAAFVNEKALLKLLYLTLERKQKVWKKRARGIKEIQRSIQSEYGERFSKHLNA